MGTENKDPKVAGADSKAKAKKKGAKHAPLPSLEAIEAGTVPWSVEVSARTGRSAVATQDFDAGALVFVEHPVIAVPTNRVANQVCHRCLAPLEANPDRAVGGNPCLPRHCTQCKGIVNAKVINALAPVRIKIPIVAEAHQVEPLLLHLVSLVDLNRSGALGEDTKATLFTPKSDLSVPVLRGTAADFTALPGVWDKKEEGWRKKAQGAVRGLHKELKALEEAGTLPGYKAGSLLDLQADFSKMNMYLNQIRNDTGYGLFPLLSVFNHSCQPNCFHTTVDGLMHVRTIVPVPKGTPLTVNYCGLTESRAERQQILQMERHITCTCPRCTVPLEQSLDRYLEGVWCPSCMTDVLVALKPGPDNDAAYETYKQDIEREEARVKALKAKAAKAKGKAKPAGKKDAAANDDEAAPEAEAEAEAKESEKQQEEEGGSNELATKEDSSIAPKIMFWRCCSCAAIQPAHNIHGTGPGDLSSQASRLVHQGTLFLQTKHPQLVAQAEESLATVALGMKGRLCPYNSKVFDALAPLINLSIKKSDAMKVLNYTLQLWSLERDILGAPTMTQLQCLDAMIDAAEHKATNANSSIIKRQFEKKLKQAQIERKMLQEVLLGQ